MFFREKLGFSLDWNYQEGGRAYVCQVSRTGFELILAENESRAGNGRVFIALDHEQEKALRKEIGRKESKLAILTGECPSSKYWI